MKCVECPDYKKCVKTNNLRQAKEKKTVTNADCIRAMTDEELADWLARTQIENVMEVMNILHIPYEEKVCMKESMAEECLEWLKQPVEAEDDN